MFALAAGATTAFDSINLLSAPRVEYERPFYRFEPGGGRASIKAAAMEAVRQISSHATIRGSWRARGLDDQSMTWCAIYVRDS